jgi:hypothetical protein
MSTPPAPRKPRNWLDALIATTLRWNDRLGRTVVPEAPPPEAPKAGGALRTGSARGADQKFPLGPPSRSR